MTSLADGAREPVGAVRATAEPAAAARESDCALLPAPPPATGFRDLPRTSGPHPLCRGTTGKHLQIGDLAARTGTTPRTLRYYEQRALLAPQRSASGYRLYTEDDVETVRRITLLLGVGLPTRRMVEVLRCVEGESPFVILECPEGRTILEEHRRRLDVDIAALGRSRDLLDRLSQRRRGARSTRPGDVGTGSASTLR